MFSFRALATASRPMRINGAPHPRFATSRSSQKLQRDDRVSPALSQAAILGAIRGLFLGFRDFGHRHLGKKRIAALGPPRRVAPSPRPRAAGEAEPFVRLHAIERQRLRHWRYMAPTFCCAAALP